MDKFNDCVLFRKGMRGNETGQYISCLNDSGTQERGLQGIKMQKIPRGSMPPDPLEACALGAHLGNRSVFILDPLDFVSSKI